MVSALAMLLALSAFTSCGDTTTNENNQNDVTPQTDVVETIPEDNKETPEEEKKVEIDYANMTAEDLITTFIADRTTVTAQEYIDLISTYSNVAITDTLTLEDNITAEALKILRDEKAVRPKTEEFIGTIIKSEAPQVRGYAMTLTSSFLGTSAENLALVKEAIKNETEPYVILKAVEALSNEGGKDAEIGQFLVASAKHENPLIRAKAALALGNSWSKDVEGAVETIIELMGDADTSVRKNAYAYAGKLADDRVIAPIVEMLNNDADISMHGDGVKSLATLWYDYPMHKNTSEAAYKATMDYFKRRSDDGKIPYWTSFSHFANKATGDSFATWREAATYVNADEITSIVTDLVKDSSIDTNTRRGAIKMSSLFLSKQQYESIGAVIDGLTEDKQQPNLKTAYNEAMKNIAE